MARASFAILLALTALLQATFFPALGMLTILPDFALVLLLMWSASRGITEGAIWALGLGLWLDFLTLDPLGTHTLSLLAVAAIGGFAGQRLFRSGVVLPIVIVVLTTFASGLIAAVVARFGGDAVSSVATMRPIVATAFLNAVLVSVGWFVLLVIDRWIPRHV